MQCSCPDLEETSGIRKREGCVGSFLVSWMFPLSSTKYSERGMDFWEGTLPLSTLNPEQQSHFPTYPGTYACFPLVEYVGEDGKWVSALLRLACKRGRLFEGESIYSLQQTMLVFHNG